MSSVVAFSDDFVGAVFGKTRFGSGCVLEECELIHAAGNNNMAPEKSVVDIVLSCDTPNLIAGLLGLGYE